MRIRASFACLPLLLAAALPAQRSASSLTGIVTDPSGSGVTAAEVLATHRATAVEHRARTNEEGVFTFPSLAPGSYDLRIEAPGFKRFESREVIVEAARSVRLDARLEVGSVQESVTVTAELPLLEQETSGQGSQVGRKLIERLPFQFSGAMRDINSVIRLVPGVRLHLNNFGYNINGGRQLGSEVLIDGVPNMYRASFNVPFNVRPALDTVAEFRVEAAVPNAEFGRTSSGVVVFQTRSGSNDYHGAAEFLLRNGILDARRYNAAQADTTRQGEVGATFSGPVRLPRYDGRNRTFFLANVTGFRRLNQPQGVVRTLPTEAMRRGDFSASPQVVYDPASATQPAARTPFAGNQIPAARFSRFAGGMLGVIPLPNRPTLESNFIGSQNQIENTNVYYLKVDHSPAARHRLTASARVTRQERNNDNSPYGGRLEGYQDFPNTWHAAAHYDFIARPNVLNRVSYGYTSWYSDFRNTPGNPYDVPNAYGPGFPVLLFQSQGLSRIGENLDRNVRARNTNLQNALSWTRGRHNLKFGFRFDYFEDDQENIGNRNGTYTFSQFASGLPGNTRAGHAFASFLLGRPQTAGMQYGLPMLGWSIRTVAPVFGGLYFGLLEGVLGGWIGYIISTLVVGGYEAPLVTLPTWGLLDGVVVALSSIIYWAWIREQPSAGTRSWRYAVMLIVCFVIWYINVIGESIGFLGAAVLNLNHVLLTSEYFLLKEGVEAEDLFGIAQSPGDGLTVFFESEQGIGAGEDGFLGILATDLEELVGDRTSAHLFEGPDVTKQLGPLLTEFRETRHGNLLCSIYTTI